MYPQQAAVPASAKGGFVRADFVAQGPFGGKVSEEVGHGDFGVVEGHRANETVGLNPQGVLQQLDGGDWALVDGAIEHQQVEAGRELVAVNGLPVVVVINRLGVGEGERGNIEGRITALADAVLRQAAGIGGVMGQATFFSQNRVNAAVKVAHEFVSERMDDRIDEGRGKVAAVVAVMAVVTVGLKKAGPVRRWVGGAVVGPSRRSFSHKGLSADQ